MTKRCQMYSVLTALVLSVVFLSGCGDKPPVRELKLNFLALVSMDASEEVRLEMGAAAVGEAEADPALSGEWELRDEDGNLRASGRVLELSRFTGEEILVTWEGVLDPGEYELIWGVPMYGGLVRRFEVVSESGGIRLGDYQEEFHTTEFPPE